MEKRKNAAAHQEGDSVCCFAAGSIVSYICVSCNISRFFLVASTVE
jgi:hypothetical protein